MDDASGPPLDDDDVLTVFDRTEESTLRPADLVDDLPTTVEDLRDRLDDLSERGLLVRDDDPRHGDGWSLTEAGASRVDDADRDVVTDVEAQSRAASAGSSTLEQETPESPPPEPGGESLGVPYEPPESDVERFDPPGTPEQKVQRREALRAAYDYLRDRGRASRAEFVEDVFPNAPGAYENPDDGWWEAVVEPGLAFLDGPEPVDGGEAWRFDGGPNSADDER